MLSERTCFIVTFEDVINFNDRPIISCNILLWGTIDKRSLTSNKLMWLNGTKQKSQLSIFTCDVLAAVNDTLFS